MNSKIIQILNELEKTGTEFWNISPETGLFLNLLIKDRNCKKILEIGTSNGYSGIWIAEALSQTGGRLHTMESHKDRHTLAQKNFKKSGLELHINSIKGHAPEDLPSKPSAFDMIFLDATKYEHLSYLDNLINRTKKGTIIITDNTHSHKKDLIPYIKKITSLKNWDTTDLSLGDGLLISIKI